MSYYKGKLADKYCGLCGGKVNKVKCQTGTYNTQTGKRKTETLIVCKNAGCFGRAPEDLMVVGSKYAHE